MVLPPRSTASYVGSEVCADCHEDEQKAWSHDWHSRALSPAKSRFVVGRFDAATFTGGSSDATPFKRGNDFLMRTSGIDGKPAEFKISWVLGGKHMQDTATVFSDGRWQLLPVYFHATGKEWVDYTEAKQGKLAPDHPFYWTNFRRTANRECLDCHVSGMEVRYDPASHAWSTKFADAGVACESCHGPGSIHADTQEPADIVRPKKLDPQRQLAVCGQCHGPRSSLFPMLDAGHHFEPGQDYWDWYQPFGIVDGRDRSGDYFADGRPKTSSFEFQALIQSKCHTEGKVTCINCHTAPHEPHDADELRPPKKGTATSPTRADAISCRSCHEAVFTAGTAHTRHQAKEAQSCIACHMPPTVSGVLDHFADHALDVPVPENTVRHGIPNACGECHQKVAPEDLAQQLDRLWPDAPKRKARRIRLADAFDEQTAAQSRAALLGVIADQREVPFNRATAALLLGQRFPADVQAVLPLLSHPDAMLRSKAVEALGHAMARGTADQVLKLAGDPSAFVRQSVAATLTAFGDARAEPMLRSLTEAPSTAGLAKPHVMLAAMLSRHGDISGALAEVEKAIALQPYLTDALVMAADLNARLGRFDVTEADLREALRFDPQNSAAKKRLETLTSGR